MSDWVLVFHATEAPSDPALLAAGARLRDVTDLATRSGLEAGALAHQSRILGVLTRAAAAVVATPTAEALLDALLGHLLDAVPARRGVVALFEGDPPAAALAAARSLEGPLPVAVDPAVAERLLRSQGAFLAPRVAAEDGSVRSVLCAPLWFSGAPPSPERIAGCVALEGPADPSPFKEEHLQLVTAVANLAASRLETLQLREETADKRRLEEDLRGAARIQASLLPEETPAVPGWELAGSTRLCSEVGADYYDFSPDDGGLLLALGDVAGKGLAAALLMASLRAAVRARLARGRPPAPRGGRRQRQPATDGAREPLRDALPRPPRDRDRRAAVGQRRPRGASRRASRRQPRGPRRHRDDPRLLPRRALGGGPDRARARATSSSSCPTASSRPPARPPATWSPSASPPWSGPTGGASASALLGALQEAVDESLGGKRRADDHTFVVVRRQPDSVALAHVLDAEGQRVAPGGGDVVRPLRVVVARRLHQAPRPQVVELRPDVEVAAAVALGEAGQVAAGEAALLALHRDRDDVQRVLEHAGLPLHVDAAELLADLLGGRR